MFRLVVLALFVLSIYMGHPWAAFAFVSFFLLSHSLLWYLEAYGSQMLGGSMSGNKNMRGFRNWFLYVIIGVENF